MAERLVVIGEITRAHGLRGELRVRPLTDHPERFERVTECVLWDTARDRRERYRITAARRQGDAVLVSIEGCRVLTEDGREVGRVTGIERGAAQDLWVVAGAGREHLIPAVPEIVLEVDLGARRVVIRPPDGLLEL